MASDITNLTMGGANPFSKAYMDQMKSRVAQLDKYINNAKALQEVGQLDDATLEEFKRSRAVLQAAIDQYAATAKD